MSNTEFEIVSEMLKRNEKNVITITENDYLSKRGVDFEEVTKLGIETRNDFIQFWVFNSNTGDFIETIEERVNTEEKSFIKFLESADVDYIKSEGTIDMDGFISDTDDVEIQQTGSTVSIKFLFGKSSQSFLGVVTEVKDKPKFPLLHSKDCTCGCQSK